MAALLFGMTAIIALYRVFATELLHFCLGFVRNHVVICGLNARSLGLARCLHPRPGQKPVVIVSPSADASQAEACGAAGARLLLGDPADPATLARAGVPRAARLIALCGEDSTNVEIVIQARRLFLEKATPGAGRLECLAHLADVDLRASLQRATVFAGEDRRCEVRFFDLFDASARRLLLDPGQLPLDHGGILETDSRQVHLVILGFGRMGRTVAARAAQLGHFANRKPIRISVIDRDAGRHEQALLFRYPRFPETCAIQFHELPIESPRARELLHGWCGERQSVPSIAVCFDQDALALEVALRLLPQLKECGVPMAVRMSREGGFASLLQDWAARPELRFYVRAFGMVEDPCCVELLEDPLNEQLATAIHEDFRNRRIQEGRDPARDRSVRPWSELDDDFKDSNRQQADHIAIKLQGIGCERAKRDDLRPAVEQFQPREIELLAEMEHARWNAERLLAGWVKGSPKDEVRKISPYLEPWVNLPDAIKGYDRQTVQLIPALLAAIGEKVCRQQPLA